ncbi:sodium-dependent nutrient amino acid transporter 1 [Caerostris extrusa]|uniref:Sodium-dependent nutrient amino acid transporter 1 n=1 Tax=Caerostris extrusa TaxID=172846 RepID=A0AAV4U690_CAEEX|nr:sodium-dependent nutrient amino acid transporter 1 [Caerostris extrusa]
MTSYLLEYIKGIPSNLTECGMVFYFSGFPRRNDWILGLRNFCNDVEFMLNKRPGIFWKFTWSCTAPIALMVIFVFGVVDESKKTHRPLSGPPTSDGSSQSWPSFRFHCGSSLKSTKTRTLELLRGITYSYTKLDDADTPKSFDDRKICECLEASRHLGPSDPLHNINGENRRMPDMSSKFQKQRRTNRFNLLKQWLQKKMYSKSSENC